MADMIASDSSDNQMHITGGETPYVVMPCDLNDFQKFVSGLLGKPQEIVSDTEGQFNIKHRDISNIYHLITHRVDKQNEAKLIQARITVHYSNGDSVTHHNVQDFESYHPIANCFPAAVTIDFSYLIKFQNKDVPEKQEITVSISTDPEIAPINSQRWFRTGLFSYRIRHTERTWATDIAGLLTSHADSIIQKHGFISNFLYEKLDELTTYLSMLVLILSILIWSMYTFKYLGQVDSFINLSTLNANKYYVASFSAFAVFGSILFCVNYFFRYNVPVYLSSSIILSDKDQVRYEKREKRQVRNIFIYICGWFLQILGAIFTAKITSLLF